MVVSSILAISLLPEIPDEKNGVNFFWLSLQEKKSSSDHCQARR
jgi:hypothetical protein